MFLFGLIPFLMILVYLPDLKDLLILELPHHNQFLNLWYIVLDSMKQETRMNSGFLGDLGGFLAQKKALIEGYIHLVETGRVELPSANIPH